VRDRPESIGQGEGMWTLRGSKKKKGSAMDRKGAWCCSG